MHAPCFIQAPILNLSRLPCMHLHPPGTWPQNLSVYAAACNDNCQCQGFNSYGWLKWAVRPFGPTAEFPDLCLYAKVNPPSCSGPGELWRTFGCGCDMLVWVAGSHVAM